MLDFFLKNELIPSAVIQYGIDWQIKNRLRTENKKYQNTAGRNKLLLIELLKNADIALNTKTANLQHYEVPTEFFRLILGPKLKYSCCNFENTNNLDDAEVDMLSLYCKRAEIENGQTILDLGCGWGSFCLYAAEKYPDTLITAVSNSITQKQYIETKATTQGLKNLRVITQDVNKLKLTEKFDRIISVEMFEHVRNYQVLLQRIASWMHINSKLFIHHFCHKKLCYEFNVKNSWMAKHFFADGLMPSADLLSFFQKDVRLLKSWQVNGMNYAKTCRAWLNNLLLRKDEIVKIFKQSYGNDAMLKFHYWQLFIRACEQLFAYRDGEEWFVVHQLFEK